MRGLEARAQRGEERAQAAELGVEAGELEVGGLHVLPAAPAADELAQATLGAQPLALEPQRVRVPGGERVLDVLAGRRRPRGGCEERVDLALEDGELLTHEAQRPILGAAAGRRMGRGTHLRAARVPPLRVVLALLAAVVALAGGGSAAAATGEPALPQRLAKALAGAAVDPSRTAALAVDLRTGEVVYSRNATVPLVPASNQKLLVAYGALAVLGPGYRFRTEVVATGSLDGATWRGDLFLKGYGDPTLTTADLDALAREVASWGITRVTGAVIGDESWFDGRRTAPGWRAAFYIHESPPLSALVVSRGWYRGRTSQAPAAAAAALLRERLAAHGVRVAKPARAGRLTTHGLPLAQDLSEPLARIVRTMGRDSDNFTAELLVKQLGAVELGLGSTAAGASVLRRELAAAQVPLAGVRLADGSGLSRLDRLTAEAVVRVLLAGAASDFRDAFLGSLAVAGVNGTLQDRMRTRPARSRVIAKTGTTRLACALSGFVRDRYVFAILHNGSPVATASARKAQDRFATALARAP